jgi:phospholipid transport system substrate-binding protein
LKTILTLLGGLLIAVTVSAEPVSPLQALQVPIDRIIDTLKDPLYQEATKAVGQKQRIQDIIDSFFDFDAIARLAVGRHWRSFNIEEKTVFTDVFSELLSNSYIGRMQGEFNNEKVIYLGEKRKSPTKSVVKTRIFRESIKIPVDYSMRLKDDAWKVYDIKVEGVSLVKNYRTQFNKILFKKSPAALIEQVTKKIEDLKDKKEEDEK